MVKFYGQFDEIVLLSAPADVIIDRVETRTTNPFGKRPEEMERILDNLAHVEPLLRNIATHEIDASAPLAGVVDEIVAVAKVAP
jgi:hypothetical protein